MRLCSDREERGDGVLVWQEEERQSIVQGQGGGSECHEFILFVHSKEDIKKIPMRTRELRPLNMGSV